MLSKTHATNRRESDVPICLATAKGSTRADEVADVIVDALHQPFSPYILDETPAVLSVGVRCMEQGYGFVWPADGKPHFIRPDRKVLLLNVDGRVPVIDSTCKVVGHQQFKTEHNLMKLCAMPSQSASASEPPEEGIDEGVPTDDIVQMIFGNITPSINLRQDIISSHARNCSSLAMKGGGCQVTSCRTGYYVRQTC